jgi:hypothetical protein
VASIKNDKAAKTESTSESSPKLLVRTSVRAGAGGSRWHF